MAIHRRLEAILSTIVNVKPHETSALLHSASSFFCILSAYFVVLPLRDEGAMSLGLSNLPSLFIGSLILTLIAAPLSTLLFSLPNLSKSKALVLIHRFFSLSLVVFFILWHTSTNGDTATNMVVSSRLIHEHMLLECILHDRWDSMTQASNCFFFVPHFNAQVSINTSSEHVQNSDVGYASVMQSGWDNHSWYYISVRIGLFLWIALLNLITISSTWARVIDVMDSESGSRLFGFIGAGATLGQLFGSLFATGMAWLGSFLLLVSAFLMELAAQFSKGISKEALHLSDEDTPMIKLDSEQIRAASDGSSPELASAPVKPQVWVMLDGLRLILSSSYLIFVSLFLWLSAVVSSFFYFQKVSVIAFTTSSAAGRRMLFAEINSFIALFIFLGQITLTGRILIIAGVTFAICSAPVVALLNMVAISVWPTWIVIAICEVLRKFVMYVVTRPGRELLFTVVSQEEKYKAKVCIDVIVQRLGDATAAGMFQLLFGAFKGQASTVSLYALPACLSWILVALHLGHRRERLVKPQAHGATLDSSLDDER